MSFKTVKEDLVTPKEALELGEYATILSIARAERFYRESMGAYMKRYDGDYSWCFHRALSIVYEAGRIQGIREERLKRRE